MQAYLMYGYGINPSKITEEELRRLRTLPKSAEMFCWFNEDDASTVTEGIYYIIGESPFEKSRHNFHDAYAIDLNEIEAFKERNAARLEEYIVAHNIEDLREHIKFHCSCFSI